MLKKGKITTSIEGKRNHGPWQENKNEKIKTKKTALWKGTRMAGNQDK